MALAFEATVAFALASVSAIRSLISFSVFTMTFSFLLTCCALVVLSRRGKPGIRGERILPWAGMAICLYLMYSTTLFDKIAGSCVILAGVPLYVYFSPKADITHLKELFISEEAIFLRRMERKERYLAHFLGLVHRLGKKVIGRG